MGGGREGKESVGEREGGSSLRARSLVPGIGGRVGWGGAVTRGGFCCSAQIFFLLTFIKF